MAGTRKRDLTPAESNRGRLDARGVFIIFDRVQDERRVRDASEEGAAAARRQRPGDRDPPVGEELGREVPGR